MSDIRSDCLTDYHAIRSSGSRPTSDILWIVLHDTEGGSAKNVARYFATDAAGGSAHLVVDDQDCYRCLKNTEIPWGAPGANTAGFHIEQCGYAKWSTVIWRSHLKTLQRAAYKTAYHCHLFDLPPVFVPASGLKARQPGVTTHAECTRAFGGDHSDPGRGWPRSFFMLLVRGYHDALGGT